MLEELNYLYSEEKCFKCITLARQLHMSVIYNLCYITVASLLEWALQYEWSGRLESHIGNEMIFIQSVKLVTIARDLENTA
jgi:hypothetical protein